MSLTNTDSASLVKAFAGYCYPKELVTFSVVHSGNVKKVTGYYEYIDRIELTSVTPSRKTSLSAVTSVNDWYHDRDAGVIYYYTTSSSLAVVARFGFFFKTGDTEVFKTSLTTGELVYYHGRMKETAFNQSIDDISSGTLGVYASSINFINNDGFYNDLARDNVTFTGSDIIIYLYIDDVTNNSVVFRGTVESVKYSGEDFSIAVKDSLKVLQKESSFTEVNSEYELTAATYPSASSDDYGYKIPYLLGRKVCSGLIGDTASVKYSRIFTDPETPGSLIQEISDKKRINTLGADDAVKLVKVSKQSTNFTQKGANGADAFLDPEFYGDITVGTNLYQVRSGTFLSVRSDNAIKTYSKLVLDRAKVTADYVYPIFGSEIIYGQFSVDLSGSGTNAIDYYEGQLFAMIPFTDAETIADETYGKSIGLFRIYRLDIENNILLCAHAYADSCFKAEFIGGLWQKYHLYFSDVSAYWSADSGKVYCFPMTVIPSYVSQSNSRRLYKMTILRFCDRARGFNLVVGDKLIDYGIFTYQYYYDSGSSSYVANLNDKVTELDDKEFYIQFMQESTNMTVGNAIHKVIRYAGLESDGGTGFSVTEDPCSFKDLDTTLGTNYYSLTSNDGATYLELLEKMLSSVFGFMYLKNDGKYGVRLFESAPYGSQLWTISEDNIAAGSIDTEFDCSELKTRLVSYGPNGDNFKFETKDDNAILLNGDISQQSKNYLENQTTYKTKVFNRRYAYFSTPTRRFNFTIINNGYEIVLGDRIAVNFSISQKWLGEDKDFELFVIGVNKSLRGVDIVAIENKFPSI